MLSSRNHHIPPKDFEHPTPKKARIRGTVDFLKSQGIKDKKEDVFRFNGIFYETGYRLLNSDSSRTHNYITISANKNDYRGRKKVIILEQIREMKQILKTKGLEGRSLI